MHHAIESLLPLAYQVYSAPPIRSKPIVTVTALPDASKPSARRPRTAAASHKQTIQITPFDE